MTRMALEGLIVVEVGNIIAGPWCGSMLADFGATVIKVEQPKTGDLIRGMGNIKNLWFAIEARNKRNITLNLKAEEGKEILWQLIDRADVLIENFRPGVFDRLGFTWEAMHKRNPRLIYSASSGYGKTGPLSHLPGFDRIGQARGGLLQVTGYPDTPPTKPGISLADYYTAMFSCIAVMFAIYDRDVNGSGEGQMIDCALTESVLRLQETIIAEYSINGSIRTRSGNRTTVAIPGDHFKTKDGKYLVVAVAGDRMFKTCMEKIGRTDLRDEPLYQNGSGRAAHGDEINKAFADWAGAHDMKECLDILGEDVPCTAVFNAADIVNDEQFRARNDILDFDTEEFGKIKMQNVCPKMMGTPGKVNWLGQPLGSFNEEIYGTMLGYTKDQLEKLEQEGVI